MISLISDLTGPWSDLTERLQQMQNTIISEIATAAELAVDRLGM